ncbi:TasA family protein (plasmid) [Haloferax sp. S1W]|uniref:TasA family protein n=1 Tax=Haloferax sp. S1W TaxID=3377110 RepID=UPI0037CA75BC
MNSQDTTLTLTRRRLLGGILTIGTGSAAAGAGTVSLFSDTEEGTGTVSVGTLDLAVGEDDNELTFLKEANVAPGDSGTSSVTLRNAGTLTGYLDIEVLGVTNDENGQSEPEEGNDSSEDDGELAGVLEVRVSLVDEDGSKTYLCGGSSYTKLGSLFEADQTFDLDHELSAGETVDFVIEWRVPQDAGNEVTSDIAGVDLAFVLSQTKDEDEDVACETDEDDDGDDGDDDVENGDGTARDAMGGWDWATLARYGKPTDQQVNGNSEPENYEVAVLKRTGDGGEARVHKNNAHWQHAWSNETTEWFSVDFNGSQVAMSIGDTTYPDKNGNQVQGVGSDDVTAVGVTATATANGSSVTLTDLTLTGGGDPVELGDVSVDASGSSYVTLDRDISDNFTLSGRVEFSWDATKPVDPSDLELRVDVKTVSDSRDDDGDEDDNDGGEDDNDNEDGGD